MDESSFSFLGRIRQSLEVCRFFLSLEVKKTCSSFLATDSPATLTDRPKPMEDEIQWILREVKEYLSADVNVQRGDVLSAWTGIRPLVRDPSKKDTQNLSRDHVIHISDAKLLTIAGGE
jgi:glycerol-3-phosphate dehydrogenase